MANDRFISLADDPAIAALKEAEAALANKIDQASGDVQAYKVNLDEATAYLDELEKRRDRIRLGICSLQGALGQ